jgi:hypothetical protein
VLSSSYELTLSEEYGEEANISTPLSEASLLALGEAASQCLAYPPPSSPHSYEHHHSPYPAPPHHLQQEFHAKFITRPIDYQEGLKRNVFFRENEK